MLSNLEAMFAAADKIDMAEGLLAYERYHIVMKRLADHYQFPLNRVVAAFCSLSPNNDYIGNLRSTASVLHGINNCLPTNEIVVSTYNHCRNRAIDYAIGHRDFLNETKGLKIINFYHNLMRPMDPDYVTIDGHMVAAWRGKNLVMKDALVKRKEYIVIADAVKELAASNFMLPNQMQAVLWFTRKRLFKVKYNSQLALFGERDDHWRTLQKIEDIRPFAPPIRVPKC